MLHFVIVCYFPDISKYHGAFVFSYRLQIYCTIKLQVALLGELGVVAFCKGMKILH